MAGLFGQLNRLVKDVTDRASDAVAKQQAALVRGKVAGRQVLDDEGNVLVDAGHVIDDAAVERASGAGKLSQLVMAAGTARMQDLRETAREQIARTGGGQEALSYDSIEEYAEARAYVGRYAGVDVTDVRGNVVIPTGRKLTEDDVRLARDAGLLSALVFAAQQPYTPPAPPPPAPPVRGLFEAVDEESTLPTARKKLSIVEPVPPSREPGEPGDRLQ